MMYERDDNIIVINTISISSRMSISIFNCVSGSIMYSFGKGMVAGKRICDSYGSVKPIVEEVGAEESIFRYPGRNETVIMMVVL